MLLDPGLESGRLAFEGSAIAVAAERALTLSPDVLAIELSAGLQDARGVYRFNADDVDDLACDIARGDVSIWEEIGAAADDGASRLVSSVELRPSRTADLDLVNTAELRRRTDAATAQVAKLQRENHELLSFAQQLSRLVVEISSRAQLRALPPETVAVITALADAE